MYIRMLPLKGAFINEESIPEWQMELGRDELKIWTTPMILLIAEPESNIWNSNQGLR